MFNWLKRKKPEKPKDIEIGKKSWNYRGFECTMTVFQVYKVRSHEYNFKLECEIEGLTGWYTFVSPKNLEDQGTKFVVDCQIAIDKHLDTLKTVQEIKTKLESLKTE